MKEQTKHIQVWRAQQKVARYMLEQRKKSLDGCALPVVSPQALLFSHLLPILKNPQTMAQA